MIQYEYFYSFFIVIDIVIVIVIGKKRNQYQCNQRKSKMFILLQKYNDNKIQ
jgi:hypothetical protein